MVTNDIPAAETIPSSGPRIIPNLTPKLAARSLKDISLGEDAYKPDFEMSDKYEAFSAELLRLALLCVTGFGFLISTICFKDGSPTTFYNSLVESRWMLVIGVIALTISAGAALGHRFLSSSCLGYQVQILRHLKRNETENWTLEEQDCNHQELEKIRSLQRTVINRSAWCIFLSCAFLFVGVVAAAYCFAATLF